MAPREIVRRILKDCENPEDLANLRLKVCRDIVGDTICADLLDYLHRDWYHLGKPRFFEKRLFQYMQIRKTQSPGGRLTISYGGRARPKRDAISSVLELLESRYNLAEAVLFHPTKCSAAAMLERGIAELAQSMPNDERKTWLNDLEEELLDYSDEQMLSVLLNESIKRKSMIAIKIMSSLSRRDLYKPIELFGRNRLSGGLHESVLSVFTGYTKKFEETIESKKERKRKGL